MFWLIWRPFLLVLVVAVVVGIAVLVRKLRKKDDNPFIVRR
jgi:hypothetical protein